MTKKQIVIERDVMVQTRDGVSLATDIYRPAGTDPVPALVHRMPYGKHGTSAVSVFILDPVAAAEHGFAVLVQDARGTFASEGVFNKLFQERADGHDTIEWAASQEWCDGNVGIYGSSYMGVTTLQAAVDAPAALKASLAYVTGSSYFENWGYHDGAFEIGFHLRRALTDAGARRARILRGAEEEPDWFRPNLAEIEATLGEFATSPVRFIGRSLDVWSLPGACAPLAPYYQNYLRHKEYDDFWRELDIVAAADRVTAPVLQIAAWYDIFIRAQIQLHRALTERGRESIRADHALMIGPWDHGAYLAAHTVSTAGGRGFGPAAAGGQAGLQSTVLAWFDKWLRGGEQEFSPVKYFHIGPDRWEESGTWPPSSAAEQYWYLHSSGEAQTLDGDGELSLERPEDQKADSYEYDPHDPAPVLGGRHIIYDLPSGCQDQRELERRSDVLVYTSSPLAEPLTIMGNNRLEITVSSSAETTDFVGVLVDVDPEGVALNVVEGIVRLPVMSSGSIRKVVVDLADTAYTFPAGNRIRVHITSSCFPRFDRNRNLAPGGDPEASVVATQQVYHDAEHPSALVIGVAR